MLKRRTDKLLAEGNGRQLLYLLAITLMCVAVAIVIAHTFYGDKITWQYIVGLFLDPGNYGGYHDMGYDGFRIVIALLSVFLFSALLVSVFTNVFQNISDSVRGGHRRYNLNHHILILGGSKKLQSIIDALEEDTRTIVVMSEKKPDAKGKYIYYCDKRSDKDALIKARTTNADIIYIIGEDTEDNHDDNNLECLEILQSICKETDHDIHCYLTLNEHTSTEVFQYLKQQEGGRLLLVDIINDFEYEAEQLLVNTDFLPVIKEKEDKTSHILIIGTTAIAKAVAYTTAHVCHYPNFNGGQHKTCITFLGEGMKAWMESFIASRPGLFELSEYTYVDSSGKCNIRTPNNPDLLDVTWEFVDTTPFSGLGRTLLNDLAVNEKEKLCVCVCEDETSKAIETVLHLPSDVYKKAKIAVYLQESTQIIKRANLTGMYGNIAIFGGNNCALSAPLFIRRSIYGQRVNFIYDQAYGNPPSKNEEEAWYKIPESHKYSSIYCANAMFLIKKCFDDNNRNILYEAEHRRWMMSVLLTGYRYGEKTDKKRFVHADIVPYEALTPEEQEKDKILIDAMDYITR